MNKLLSFVIFFIFSVHLANSKQNKPNILFIFADDQCYETIRELGLTDIDTPNLDRLTKAGTTFTRAYNMGSWSGAVCVASRHMLNTGRFLWEAEKASKVAEEERNCWPMVVRVHEKSRLQNLHDWEMACKSQCRKML